MSRVLDLFHPVIRGWFTEAVGRPTDVQEQAWPGIARGEHLLATAPTGSGKTLTAFLWALNQLATGAWEGGACRVLYVSPLKALNNDIRENLLSPLARIRERFELAGEAVPQIRVLTRSGDTPQKDRRKMGIHPPEILITTPESLNLLLSSQSGIAILGHLKTVILDEIHACAATKRGVHLITAVDRLVRLSGEFQRIGLSATLKDHQPVMEMIGGYQLEGSSHDPIYTPRQVSRVQSDTEKKIRVSVAWPERPWEKAPDTESPDKRAQQTIAPENEAPEIERHEFRETDPDFSVWDLLAGAFISRLARNRATLIFTNGRRLCEKLTFKVNQAAGTLAAYSHHGSLSKRLRQDVEKKLRQGELKAIVATSSLEMGIDIGDLDEVVMVQSPMSISSAIQRIGRAGHGVGLESCGTIFPGHVQDLIPSAVLARAVADRDLEPMAPVTCPLDVLAQVLISMTGTETWDLDRLFAVIRTSSPYRKLPREQFDLVIRMLAGEYAGTRIRDLNPRISVDRLENTVSAKKGALLALYMSGGTIPDRGYYQLRHAQTNARIGELDEEYVWEAKTGQIATVGSRNWKITKITHNDVFALPAGNNRMDAPFWIAESMNRDFHFSCRIGEFLEMAAGLLDQGSAGRNALSKTLIRDYFMDEAGARALIRFCRSQAEAAAMPHKHRVVLEYVRTGPGAAPGHMLVIHTLWGGRVNRPFALALGCAWAQVLGEAPQIFPGNDAVVVQLPCDQPPEKIMALVTRDTIEDLIRQGLESSGFFGARFRENAGRALLVTRQRMNQRMPLWMTRLQSQRLLEKVISLPDFPILLETWRTCLQDEFDMKALHQVLEGLESGAISWEAVHTAGPSPFAAAMAWQQINQYMYQEDQPASGPSALTADLIREALYTDGLRPRIPMALVRQFERKRQRLADGYAPQTPSDLLDWVKERLALPWPEWEALVRAVGLDDPADRPKEWETLFRDKLARLRPCVSGTPDLVIALEWVPDLVWAWFGAKDWHGGQDWYGGRRRQDTGPAIQVLSLESGHPLPDKILAETASRAGQDTAEDAAGLGAGLLGQWLGFYGPLSPETISVRLGLDREQLDRLLYDLADSREIISGTLVADDRSASAGEMVCEARNFETLMRMLRAASRPDHAPMEISALPGFLAEVQGLLRPRDGEDGLFDILEQLSCLPLPAALWETQILPARFGTYYPAFMDSLMQEGTLFWLGQTGQKVLFCLGPDLEFLAAGEPHGLAACFKESGEQHGFSDLLRLTGTGRSELAGMIWEAVWQGNLTSDTLQPLRQGIENRFSPPEPLAGDGDQSGRWAGIRGMGRESGRTRSRRRTGMVSARTRSRITGPAMPGRWFMPLPAMDRDGTNSDLVDREELNRERVRLLLDRYGILFRELLDREATGFRWNDLFRTLYLMELSGEVLAGAFFKEIQGPQFASRRGAALLAEKKTQAGIYWLCAMDPASACGLGPLSRSLELPSRLASNLMVYRGNDLAMVSSRHGRDLVFQVLPDDPDMDEILSPLKIMMTRRFSPVPRVTVETVNGRDAAGSPYRKALESLFETAGSHKTLDLFLPR